MARQAEAEAEANAAVSAKMAARRNAAPAANYENKARGDGRGRANAIPGGGAHAAGPGKGVS